MNKNLFPLGVVLLVLALAASAWLGWPMGIGYAIGGIALSLAGAWSIKAAIENDVSELGMLGAIVLLGLIVIYGWFGLGIFVVSVGGGLLVASP